MTVERLVPVDGDTSWPCACHSDALVEFVSEPSRSPLVLPNEGFQLLCAHLVVSLTSGKSRCGNQLKGKQTLIQAVSSFVSMLSLIILV